MNIKIPITAIIITMTSCVLFAAEYHVSPSGLDSNKGSASKPFKTISAGARIAQPGDVITVHEGIYRERVNPPRGGTSADNRITYQAAPGEKVVIKGSEIVTGWTKVKGDTWKVTLSNSFFGDFNPYSDLIKGDWYQAQQAYHTGSVYLNGHWLKEAPRKAYVTGVGEAEESARDLLNISFLQPGGCGRVAAAKFASKSGDVKQAGKSDVGPMNDGDWLAYEGVDFGKGTDKLVVSTASPIGGGFVDIRLGTPKGKLLGSINAGLTAEWTHFQSFAGKMSQKLSGPQTIVLVFRDRPVAPSTASDTGYWFAEVDEISTTIWAQFKGVDPNKELVEINVRQAVFYSDEPGRNYITVRGFTLEQAATPWSPPTAEQIGLIGTHWSKGWIIENNTIQYSACSGVTLGKHGDEFDNTYNYYRTISLGLKAGWNRDTIGSHLVRNNHILNCGQGGIIGSLGCSFSTITGNEIHEIRQQHQYGGCETAGIKLHGAIDVLVAGNHVYRCAHWGGIWIDWMGQGARVTCNLLHDNSNDLMLEMNHGPMLIDNNILLSKSGVRDASGGGAYAHNLISGNQTIWSELTHRHTPIFKPHSTDVIPDPDPALANAKFEGLGVVTVDQHDDQFINNLFVMPAQLLAYDRYAFKIEAAGNLYLAGSKPSVNDRDAIIAKGFDPRLKLTEKADGWWLEMKVDPSWQAKATRSLVTSELLGRAQLPNAPFENRDGTPYRIDVDYFAKKRSTDNPAPGPFRWTDEKKMLIKIWSRD